MSEPFDYSLDYAQLDLRQRPDLYRTGKGEQGVLLVEPYKSEILPYWRFKSAAAARKSSATIYKLFLGYLQAGDFVGADMARKFLQMGWTRARRYANHRGGRKYDPKSGRELPRGNDPEKAQAAAIFYKRYVAAKTKPQYVRLKEAHRQRYKDSSIHLGRSANAPVQSGQKERTHRHRDEPTRRAPQRPGRIP